MPAWLRVVFFTALGLAGLSLFVLAATSSDSKLFERWFPVLLIINQAIAAALFVVVSAMAFRLIQNVRNRVFGAKMTARLALTVAGMSSFHVHSFTLSLQSSFHVRSIPGLTSASKKRLILASQSPAAFSRSNNSRLKFRHSTWPAC